MQFAGHGVTVIIPSDSDGTGERSREYFRARLQGPSRQGMCWNVNNSVPCLSRLSSAFGYFTIEGRYLWSIVYRMTRSLLTALLHFFHIWTVDLWCRLPSAESPWNVRCGIYPCNAHCKTFTCQGYQASYCS
jgi:hypothetical protein